MKSASLIPVLAAAALSTTALAAGAAGDRRKPGAMTASDIAASQVVGKHGGKASSPTSRP